MQVCKDPVADQSVEVAELRRQILGRTLLIAPVGAKRSGLRATDVLASGFGRSGLLRDDTSVSPPSRLGEAGGVSLCGSVRRLIR